MKINHDKEIAQKPISEYAKFMKTLVPANIPVRYKLKPIFENGSSLLVTEIPSFAAPKPLIPVSKQMEYLRVLAVCGFAFTGFDLAAKTFHVSEGQMPEVLYPKDPILLTGLKALSISAKKLWIRFYNNADNLLRCDYRIMKEEEADVLSIMKDIIRLLPEKLQNFAMELHQRYVDMGMVCVVLYDNEVHFSYAYVKNSKRLLSTREIY